LWGSILKKKGILFIAMRPADTHYTPLFIDTEETGVTIREKIKMLSQKEAPT
jgi:hypothetical protein